MRVDEALRELVKDAVRQAIREELPSLMPKISQEVSAGEFLSLKAAARLAGVSVNTVRKWLGKPGLPEYRAGRVVRVRRVDLERFLAQRADPEDINTDRHAAEILARRQQK